MSIDYILIVLASYIYITATAKVPAKHTYTPYIFCILLGSETSAWSHYRVNGLKYKNIWTKYGAVAIVLYLQLFLLCTYVDKSSYT